MEVIGNSGSGVNLCIRMTLNVKGDADCRKVDQGEDCQYLESATAREGVERAERAAGARARRRRGATILEYFHLGDGRQTPLCSLFEATTSANWSSLLVGKQNALPGAWGRTGTSASPFHVAADALKIPSSPHEIPFFSSLFSDDTSPFVRFSIFLAHSLPFQRTNTRNSPNPEKKSILISRKFVVGTYPLLKIRNNSRVTFHES